MNLKLKNRYKPTGNGKVIPGKCLHCANRSVYNCTGYDNKRCETVWQVLCFRSYSHLTKIGTKS